MDKPIKAEIVKRILYFGGKRIAYSIRYEDGTEKKFNEDKLALKIRIKDIELTNGYLGKNNKIFLNGETENLVASDFWDNSLNIGDTVLASFADPANYGQLNKHYAKMIYGEILDIVDIDRIKLKILKIQGKSARYNNLDDDEDNETIIEEPIDSKLTVKYTHKE